MEEKSTAKAICQPAGNPAVTVLCPKVELGKPLTGGHVYDFRFFDAIKESGISVQFFDDAAIGREKGEPLWKLPFRVLSNTRRLTRNKMLIFGSSLFAYYLIPFTLLRILFPRLRLVGIHHHFRFQEHTGLKRKLYKFLEMSVLKQCYTVINPCPYTRDVLLQHWKNGRVTTLENSFDTTPRTFSSHEKYRFLYVGTVYERKGLKYLMEAVNILPDDKKNLITVDVVGTLDENSSYVKDLRTFIAANHLENIVNLRGRVSDEELQKYYSEAYAFILPSLHEGYGLVIVEAMAYGVPVIAFNNSAMPYTIKHEYNGLLADNKVATSLRDQILRIMDDSSLHRKLSENAYEYAQNAYSIEDFKRDTKKLVQSWEL